MKAHVWKRPPIMHLLVLLSQGRQKYIMREDYWRVDNDCFIAGQVRDPPDVISQSHLCSIITNLIKVVLDTNTLYV